MEGGREGGRESRARAGEKGEVERSANPAPACPHPILIDLVFSECVCVYRFPCVCMYACAAEVMEAEGLWQVENGPGLFI